MKRIAILGHFRRGKEVIKLLEKLGGINTLQYIGNASDNTAYYIKDEDSVIKMMHGSLLKELNYKVYTLEEYEEILENSIIEKEKYLKVSFEEALNWYNKGKEWKQLALTLYTEEELIFNTLPKTWEDYLRNCSKFPAIEAFEIMTLEGILSLKKYAIFRQLELLKNYYNSLESPIDWESKTRKYNIIQGNGKLRIVQTYYNKRFLSFKSERTAILFMEAFKDLIKNIADLI